MRPLLLVMIGFGILVFSIKNISDNNDYIRRFEYTNNNDIIKDYNIKEDNKEYSFKGRGM